MKAPSTFLTRAESELMRLLWDHGELTVTQLQERLERTVAYTTVLTLVRILEKKGYVAHSTDPMGRRAHVFRAAVAETTSRKRHLKDLVERLFGGRAESLASGLIDDELLDRDELEALRKQIDLKLSGSKKGKS